MDVAGVKLFLEVAEAGSLSKVAARRQTAQSHISRQVTDFEDRCGGRLFRRTGRGVALTEFGERALARLRPWLQETEQIAQELHSESGQLTGQVRWDHSLSGAPLMTRLSAARAQRSARSAKRRVGARRHGHRHGGPARSCSASAQCCENDRQPCVVPPSSFPPGDPLTADATLNSRGCKACAWCRRHLPATGAIADEPRWPRLPAEAVAEADSSCTKRGWPVRAPSAWGPSRWPRNCAAARCRPRNWLRPDLSRRMTLLPKQGASPACRVVAQTVQELVAAWETSSPNHDDQPAGTGGTPSP